jgi:hypothetical protein
MGREEEMVDRTGKRREEDVKHYNVSQHDSERREG